jgi:hypothetical protein
MVIRADSVPDADSESFETIGGIAIKDLKLDSGKTIPDVLQVYATSRGGYDGVGTLGLL